MAPGSASVAVTVVTVVEFSAMLIGGTGAAAIRGDHRGIVVEVADGDGDRLAVGVGAVGDLHHHVVDVVAAGIGGRFVIGRRDEGQRAGRGIDAELGGIGAAGDGVSQRRAGIGVARGHRGDGGGVLGDVDRGIGAAAIRGDHRGIVVDVGDGDGDGLAVGVAAVGDLHHHVIDVVAAGIGRGFAIRRRDEGQGAGRGIDAELGRHRPRR